MCGDCVQEIVIEGKNTRDGPSLKEFCSTGGLFEDTRGTSSI